MLEKKGVFAKQLLSWYANNKRDLPWREDNNPYLIWLSEIILQQTRVDQGLSYFNAFKTTFPTIKDLAHASEEQVLKLWQGLGYYSRARNLHLTAKLITDHYGGKFPNAYDALLQLKGIGPYTAAAIASIAFDLPYPTVDGNVYRVLARIFGIDVAIDSAPARKVFEAKAMELMDKQNASAFNQAMMEFGALACTPKQPQCDGCVFQQHCYAYAKGIQLDLPVKTKKTKVKHRHFNYFVLRHHHHVLLRQRQGKDIWKNMYDFPLLESSHPIPIQQRPFKVDFTSKVYKHVLTHQLITANFHHVICPLAMPFEALHALDGALFKEKEKNSFQWVKVEEVENFPLPRLIDRYWIEHFSLFL